MIATYLLAFSFGLFVGFCGIPSLLSRLRRPKAAAVPPPDPAPETTSNGFNVGQIVEHKIDGVRFVIVGFMSERGRPQAEISYSSALDSYADVYLAEVRSIEEGAAAQ